MITAKERRELLKAALAQTKKEVHAGLMMHLEAAPPAGHGINLKTGKKKK